MALYFLQRSVLSIARAGAGLSFFAATPEGQKFFRFEWRGEVKLRFVYPQVVYRDGRSRETDEVSDFCHWLVEAVKKKFLCVLYVGF